MKQFKELFRGFYYFTLICLWSIVSVSLTIEIAISDLIMKWNVKNLKKLQATKEEAIDMILQKFYKTR